MANITDYLLWRGDLDFTCSEFNEVDNLILSELVYVDFAGIVPEPGGGDITLKEASGIFFDRHTDEEIQARVSSTKMAAFLMRDMAETRRFSDIRLSAYINDINLDEQSQFCAMTVQLGDGRTNVVFSGTDSTIVGWKEDFNMIFLDHTPGQQKAIFYLEDIAARTNDILRIMGHSKGGNLAVYAATHCSETILERIEIIYSNDGPGFTDSMIQMDHYQKLLPRIHTIIPESSIVGMLFEHEEEFEVVASTGSGAGQHDVMSWEVLGAKLIHLNKVDEKALLLDQSLKSWIAGMDTEQRSAFVDILFGILNDADIHTVDDLASMNPAKFMEVLKLHSLLDKEDQEMLKESLLSFFQQSGNALYEILIKNRTSRKC